MGRRNRLRRRSEEAVQHIGEFIQLARFSDEPGGLTRAGGGAHVRASIGFRAHTRPGARLLSSARVFPFFVSRLAIRSSASSVYWRALSLSRSRSLSKCSTRARNDSCTMTGDRYVATHPGQFALIFPARAFPCLPDGIHGPGRVPVRERDPD